MHVEVCDSHDFVQDSYIVIDLMDSWNVALQVRSSCSRVANL